MAEENRNPILTVTVGFANLPPGRRRGDASFLMGLPQVQEILAQIREGLEGDGPCVGLQLNRADMERLKIKNPSRILRDLFEAIVEEEKLVTKSGKPLEVCRYIAYDDDEVFCVGEIGIAKKIGLPPRRTRKARSSN